MELELFDIITSNPEIAFGSFGFVVIAMTYITARMALDFSKFVVERIAAQFSSMTTAQEGQTSIMEKQASLMRQIDEHQAKISGRVFQIAAVVDSITDQIKSDRLATAEYRIDMKKEGREHKVNVAGVRTTQTEQGAILKRIEASTKELPVIRKAIEALQASIDNQQVILNTLKEWTTSAVDATTPQKKN